MPCVIGRSGTALKSARPSEIGTTIKAELKTRRVIQATTSNSTIRSTKPYLLKDGIGKTNQHIIDDTKNVIYIYIERESYCIS